MLALIRCHRKNDGLGSFECGFVVNIHILQSLVHTREHTCKVLDVTHLLNLLNLVVEILEGELVLGKFLLQLACLFLVKLLLSLLYEGDHVTHSENTVCDTLRVELVDSLHLLARADKFDWFADHSAD